MGERWPIGSLVILLALGIAGEPQYTTAGIERAGFEYLIPGGPPTSPLHQDKVLFSTTPSPFDFNIDSSQFVSSDGPYTSSTPSSFASNRNDFSYEENEPIIEITPRSFIGPTSFPESSGNFGPSEDYADDRRGYNGPFLSKVPPSFKSSRPTKNPLFISSIKPTSFRPGGGGRSISGPTNSPFFGGNGNFLNRPDGLSPVPGTNFFESFGTFGVNVQRQCPTLRPCLKSPYRTIDGSCNNPKNPWWGAAGTPYGRLIAPKYSDRNHAPPVGINGELLPEPRVLSRLFLPSAKKDDYKYTLATMQWGQIVTHDMSLAMNTLPNPQQPECCNERGPLFNQLSKGEPCFPIVLPPDDPIFNKYGQRCMEFLRTTTDRMIGCPTGKGSKPLSEVTHWLDASIVYGSTVDRARDLRLGRGGLLRVEIRNNQQWPTVLRNSTLSCARPAPEQVCYKTGDDRVNQNPQLALIQIVLHREHNRLATILYNFNPHWEDERIYQEARRILIAEIQHITYYEWLPTILGGKNLRGLIYFDGDPYVNDFDERINPSILNEHAQGAFRFLHTNIQGQLQLMSDIRRAEGHIRLPEHMLDVSILETGAFDDLSRGMTTQLQHGTDRYHSIEVTQNLFRRPESPNVGFDLKSLDIQRGRDHGLASYNSYREHCGYSRARKFSDFSDLIHSEDIQRLEKVYNHPEDVDLSVGGALEGNGPEGAAGLGPTFACIIKEQFLRSRMADRFFYEHGNHPGAFSPAQLTEIRKSSLSRLLCDNSEEIFTMQPRAFELLSNSNPLVPCEEFSSIPALNLEAWRDARRTKQNQNRIRY